MLTHQAPSSRSGTASGPGGRQEVDDRQVGVRDKAKLHLKARRANTWPLASRYLFHRGLLQQAYPVRPRLQPGFALVNEFTSGKHMVCNLDAGSIGRSKDQIVQGLILCIANKCRL
jgi:hypothetical protein